jgi:streptogrisin C
VTANKVVLTATSQAAANAFLRAAGVARADVTTTVSPHRPRPEIDIVGGEEFTNWNAFTSCSIGFPVTGGQAGARGFLSAGHCGAAGDSISGPDFGPSLGTVAASSFPGSDMGVVAANGSWVSTGLVRNYNGGHIGVAGAQEASAGASVCRSGITTGFRCGRIFAKGVTANYPDGKVYGLTLSTACSAPGDSGGSVVHGNQAQGIHSGSYGGGGCTGGGASLYQPIQPMLDTFGVSVTTAPGAVGATMLPNAMGGCMDAGPWTHEGSPVHLALKCGGTEGETFHESPGSEPYEIRPNTGQNRCLATRDGATGVAAKVVVYSCNGSENQKWLMHTDGRIVHFESGLCMEGMNFPGDKFPRPVYLTYCGTNPSQVWFRG